jgi:type I restriction enzyme S subunit
MSGFHEVRIGDVLTFQRGFDITKNEQSDGDVPIVSSSGVSSFHNKWKVKGPGVVIGRKGTLGTVHFLCRNYWPHDTTLWIKDFKGNEPRFLSYFLRTLRLETFDVGAANPTLNRNHVHGIRVVFPEKIDTQRRIAAILAPYDGLIENNRRRIASLEA